MKRLALAVALVALVACKKSETDQQPTADTSAAPPAPAMSDSSKMMGDSSKMMGDSAKKAN